MMLTGGGTFAWAYEVPNGYEIKKVFIGSLNGDGTEVNAETFESGTFNSSVFGVGTLYHATSSERLNIVNYTTVAKPDEGESVSFLEDGVTPIVPSYVDGKCLQAHHRNNSVGYNTIDFPTVSSGILVFSYDFNFGGDNQNNNPYLSFVDSEGNNILRLGFKSGSGATEYFQYTVGDGEAYNDGTVGSSKVRGKYTGFGLKDIIINLETGAVTYTLDHIGTDGKRYVSTSTRGINIGTGKSISQIRFTQTGASKTSLKWWIDNVSLYTVGVDASHHYTIKATTDNGTVDLKDIASGTCKEDLEYEAVVPYVIEKNNKFYVLKDESITDFGKSFTMGKVDQIHSFNYVLDESIVGFYEGEAATGSNSLYSNGAYGTVAAQNKRNRGIAAGTLSPGIYQFVGRLVADGNSGRAITIRESENDPMASLTGNNTTRIVSTYFVVNTTTGNLYINGANAGTVKTNLSTSFDYVLIRKLNVNDDPVLIGAINNNTEYLADMTEKVTLKPGDSYRYQFVNHNGHASNWNNWVLPVYNSSDENKIVVRADNYEDKGAANTGCTSDFDWTNFVSEMDGATVDMTVSFTADKVFTMSAAITTASGEDWTYSYTSDYTGSTFDFTGDDYIKVALSVSQSWAEVLSEGMAAIGSKITAAGWATLYTPYALDFSGVDEGLEAYTAACENNKVTLTKVDDVPANSGVVLKGAANNYSIPVIASSTTDKGELTGSATAATAWNAYDGFNLYMLAKNAQGEAQFTKVTSGSIAAGKAFLKLSNTIESRSLTVGFADEATGISDATRLTDNGEWMKDNVYNLNGQRVNKPKKGLYVVNGKKVIINK